MIRQLLDQITTDNTATHSYDAAGNRTDTGYTVTTGNRLTSDGLWSYSYDGEGNVTQRVSGSSPDKWNYYYDHRNRLVKIEKLGAGDQLVWSQINVYDGIDRLMEKRVDANGSQPGGETRTRYLYDGDQIFREDEAPPPVSGPHVYSVKARYLWALDEVFARMDPNGNVTWALNDRQGTVKDVADANSILDTRTFDSFGKLTNQTAPSVDFIFAHNGWLRHATAELYIQNGYSYDPSTGRWFSQAGDGPNPYQFMGNEPNHISPANLPGDAVANAAAMAEFNYVNLLAWTEVPTEMTFWGGLIYATLGATSLLPGAPGLISGGLLAATQFFASETGQEFLEGMLTGLTPLPLLLIPGTQEKIREVAKATSEWLRDQFDPGWRARQTVALMQESVGEHVEHFLPQADMVAAQTQTCFRRNTPVLTKDGFAYIQYIDVDDLVWARDPDNPDGPPVLKRVAAVSVREAFCINLHVRGQIIGTTMEHIVYAYGRGWIAAGALTVGDWFLSGDGQWVELEDKSEPGELEQVYNLEVEDLHTYFVGRPDWGFSIWVHNGLWGLCGRFFVAAGKATLTGVKWGAWKGPKWVVNKGLAKLGWDQVTGKGMRYPEIMRAFFTGGRLAKTPSNIGALRWYKQLAENVLARYQRIGYQGPGVATQLDRIQQILRQLGQWGLGG